MVVLDWPFLEAIEHGPLKIVDLPIKNGDFSIVYVSFTRGYWFSLTYESMGMVLTHGHILLPSHLASGFWMEPQTSTKSLTHHGYVVK